MNFYSKETFNQGTAEIEGKKFSFSFSDEKFSFIPLESIPKDGSWKLNRRSDLKNLNIACIPYGLDDTTLEIIGTREAYIPYNNNFQFTYDKLFIHRNHYKIDVLEFVGPSINHIVQNITMKRSVQNGKALSRCSLKKSLSIDGNKCDLTTVNILSNRSDQIEIAYASHVYLHFYNSLTKEEAFKIYLAFIRLVQLLSHRQDIYFDCNTLETDGDEAIPTGSMYFSNISKANVGKNSQPISLETILPIIGDLINYIIDGGIIPLFIPAKRDVTFSDSYILATGWAQMVFKQAYVPSDQNYSIRGLDVYCKQSNGESKKVSLNDQLSAMIMDSFPYVSKFANIALPFLVSNINIQKYTSIDLPKRLKTVRNAIAHGSSEPKDYEYTPYEMALLLIAVYHGIFKKKFNLEDSLFKLAMAELFFDSTQVFSEWRKTPLCKERSD